MNDLVVRAVATGRERQAFLKLPWSIYRDDPHWIPPLRLQQKELVGYARHPFYQDAEGQTFLAWRAGRVCGRILAIVNHAHNRYYREERGFFGFLEAIDDPSVIRQLLQEAARWLASRGMKTVRGPCNPSLNYEGGVLLEGFGSSPCFMMPYGRPYYPSHLEQTGFLHKAQDLFAFWGHVNMLDKLDEKLRFIVQEATRRFGISMRSLQRKRFKHDVRMFMDIYNKSLVGTWGFVPLSDAEAAHMSAALRFLIVPELTSVAEVDGRAVGASFGLLDYNPRIRAIDGRLFPFGFLRLLWNRRKIQALRLISTNVLPEYQRWGVGLLLLSHLVPQILKWGIQEAEFSWVLESNQLSRGTLERGGATRTKTYRIYDGDIDEILASG